MVLYHRPVKRVHGGSGGRRRATSDKRLLHYGGFFARGKYEKEAGEERREERRTKGGSTKVSGKVLLFASVTTPQGTKKARITAVVDNPSNRHYARENILTRGAVIDTELGRARITSRPGQEGAVNAVLLKEQPPAAPAKK
jgi:small subunit ribosomal protein S8e